MTPRQETLKRLSELRSEYRDTDDAKQSNLLLSEIDQCQQELKLQTAVECRELDSKPETREAADLFGGVTSTDYLGAALAGRAPDGRAGEVASEMGLRPGHVPTELMLTGKLETRTTTDAESAQNQQAWVDRLFSGTSASALGISMMSADPGVQSVPLTATGGSPSAMSREQQATTSAWTITTTELKPRRTTLHLELASEDTYRLPALQQALERDLSMAMTERLDRAVFLGLSGATTGTDDVTGLTTLSGIDEVTLTQAQKVRGTDWVSKLMTLVDGKFARSASDVRLVFSQGTNSLLASSLHNASADSETVGGFLMRQGFSWTMRGDLASGTAANAWAGFVGLSRGIEGAGCLCMWASSELVVDSISQASSGKKLLTLSSYWDIQYPRKANFRRIKFVA